MQIGQPGFISMSQTSNTNTKCNSNGNKVHSKQRHERPLRSIIMTRTRRTNSARFSRMRRGGKVRFEQKSWRLCKFDTASSRPATATTRGRGTPRGSPTSECRQRHRRARIELPDRPDAEVDLVGTGFGRRREGPSPVDRCDHPCLGGSGAARLVSQ